MPSMLAADDDFRLRKLVLTCFRLRYPADLS